MTLPFDYNKQVFGGTEYMGRGWHKHIGPHVPKFKNYLSLIIPGNVPPVYELLNVDEQLIVWMHNTPQQFSPENTKILKHPQFIKRLKYYVVPSEEHKRLTLEEIPIDPDQIVVIPNAIDVLAYNPIKFDNPKQIKLIHTSSPDRGFDVLMNAVELINEDFRLEVYNSFNPDLVENLPATPKVRFFGKTPKATVMEAVESAHIHAYPSTYPETFCISQVEAMSAGLACVTSNLGALPEVSGGFGYMYEYTEDREAHTKIFAEHLTKAIQDIKTGNWNPEEQIKFVNSEYSWERHKERWLELHEKL